MRNAKKKKLSDFFDVIEVLVIIFNLTAQRMFHTKPVKILPI